MTDWRSAAFTGEENAAYALLDQTPLIDAHNDFAWAARELARAERRDFAPRELFGRTRTGLASLRAGRVGAQFWSVFVPCSLTGGAAVTATLEQIDFIHRLVNEFPLDLELARSADDVETAISRGRIASLLGAEGGHSIDESLGVLRALQLLGVRYLTLTHNESVSWADSATGDRRSGGLSTFGRDVVQELNRLGMLVDLAHASEELMAQAIDTSSAPVIFSHSSARALVDTPRNVPDHVLTRMAEGGGVCMVTFVPQFVNRDCLRWETEVEESLVRLADGRPFIPEPRRRALAEAEVRARGPQPRASIEDVADHIEHVREIAGVDHVGIGSDFDGCAAFPTGLDDVSRYPCLLVALIQRGWSDADCRKLVSANTLRVMREAESTARAMMDR